MSAPIRVRLGTPDEQADVRRQVDGVPAEPLFRLTFYGHLVPNPEPGMSGTLAPAIASHQFDAHPAVAYVAEAMLPHLLRALLDAIEEAH